MSFPYQRERRHFYQCIREKMVKIRHLFSRPLTLTEKILALHLEKPFVWKRGESILPLLPDHVAMQDATAQMALLQFMLLQRRESAVPTTLHCDHLITARRGASFDLEDSLRENNEIFSFLQTAASKYGMGFWQPGMGIIHQVILENYAFPGGLLLGTDSHTPNGGGLGMMAVGVGGADAVDGLAGIAWELQAPRLIGIHLKGQLSDWVAPKDLILSLSGQLTTKGGTGCVIEYFGPGVRSLSCTGRATVCNMGAELGATTSIFPYDSRAADYLRVTQRSPLVEWADAIAKELQADPEVVQNAESYYDQLIEVDLSYLEPYVNGPYSPDRARSLSEFIAWAKSGECTSPLTLSAGLIGSCTNSSYEDMDKVCSLARQVTERGFSLPIPLLITPGSRTISLTLERDGHLPLLRAMGANILSSACGPCIGQWQRKKGEAERTNSILTSYNRNFAGRNDGSQHTHCFLASPELVLAISCAGRLDFDPRKDLLLNSTGTPFLLCPPKGREFPERGFIFEKRSCIHSTPNPSLSLSIAVKSRRLQELQLFPPPNRELFQKKMAILAHIEGKCTTDHISPAGKWLRFRGHLENISDNLLSGAYDKWEKVRGMSRELEGEELLSFAELAKHYQKRNLPWIIIADENYGEGSSREHAAMEVRFLGGAAVLALSFARIHETNLKKQGVLALQFAEKKDSERVQRGDYMLLTGLQQFAPKELFIITLLHKNGEREELSFKHSYTPEQIDWFWAGSALGKYIHV